MEKRLKLFKPEEKINPWLLTLLLLWFVAMLLNILSSKFPSYENLNFWGIIFAIIAFLYSIFFAVRNFFAYEPTNGVFTGPLIIDFDKIACNTTIYTIYEIEKIAILNDCYRGNFNGEIRAWQPKRSNGLKNYIEIYKKDGSYMKYFFLQTKAENMGMFISELEIYYKRGILHPQNYENIVNDQDSR
jgi:hypothetical protein